MPGNVEYRLGKLHEMGLLKGFWLDCGCADGGYTQALVEWGVDRAIGIDPDPSRIRTAIARRQNVQVEYYCCSTELPFPDMMFDGVLLNEVLEHVEDEAATLREIRRVLRPFGHLVVMSPNRWFPFEGHGIRVFGQSLGFPVPFVPWLPSRMTMRFMAARNYWPYELHEIVAASGLKILLVGYVLPVFEVYPWLPSAMIELYKKTIPWIEKTPLKRFGVSTLVVATRTEEA